MFADFECSFLLFSAHPRFLNQLSTGIDIIGLAAEWITAAANTNMQVFQLGTRSSTFGQTLKEVTMVSC